MLVQSTNDNKGETNIIGLPTQNYFPYIFPKHWWSHLTGKRVMPYTIFSKLRVLNVNGRFIIGNFFYRSCNIENVISYKKINQIALFASYNLIMCSCFHIMITNRNYFWIGCKKSKSSVWPIDWFKIVSVHEIIEILVPITYLQNIITCFKLGKSMYCRNEYE